MSCKAISNAGQGLIFWLDIRGWLTILNPRVTLKCWFYNQSVMFSSPILAVLRLLTASD